MCNHLNRDKKKRKRRRIKVTGKTIGGGNLEGGGCLLKEQRNHLDGGIWKQIRPKIELEISEKYLQEKADKKLSKERSRRSPKKEERQRTYTSKGNAKKQDLSKQLRVLQRRKSETERVCTRKKKNIERNFGKVLSEKPTKVANRSQIRKL